MDFSYIIFTQLIIYNIYEFYFQIERKNVHVIVVIIKKIQVILIKCL